MDFSSSYSNPPVNLKVLPYTQGLEWYGTKYDHYYAPTCAAEQRWLEDYLLSLRDGSYLPVRGRDFCSHGLNDKHPLTDWDYGVAVKNGNRLFFLYERGDIESFAITAINYQALVHFCVEDHGKFRRSDSIEMIDPYRVVVISHGWSQTVGPDYPLIRSLESVAVRKGWKVIVPDFRPTYRYVASRARSERVREIYEELLCLDPRPERVVLVGHRQGGACSSLACTDRVVESANITGLLLLGSESPLSLDGMDWVPKVKHRSIVHAKKDNVISLDSIQHLSKKWDVQVIELDSAMENGSKDCWGDDIHHDFLAKDIMTAVVAIFEKFLDACESTNIVEGALVDEVRTSLLK